MSIYAYKHRTSCNYLFRSAKQWQKLWIEGNNSYTQLHSTCIQHAELYNFALYDNIRLACSCLRRQKWGVASINFKSNIDSFSHRVTANLNISRQEPLLLARLVQLDTPSAARYSSTWSIHRSRGRPIRRPTSTLVANTLFTTASSSIRTTSSSQRIHCTGRRQCRRKALRVRGSFVCESRPLDVEFSSRTLQAQKNQISITNNNYSAIIFRTFCLKTISTNILRQSRH